MGLKPGGGQEMCVSIEIGRRVGWWGEGRVLFDRDEGEG